MIAISLVPQDFVGQAWKQAAPFLQQAIDASIPDDRVDLFVLFEKCVSGEWMLWVVLDDDEVIGAFTCHVSDGLWKTLVIPWVGCKKGTIVKWYKPMLDIMEDVGQKLGCRYMEGYGRNAWGALLGREGWRKAHVVFEKEID